MSELGTSLAVLHAMDMKASVLLAGLATFTFLAASPLAHAGCESNLKPSARPQLPAELKIGNDELEFLRNSARFGTLVQTVHHMYSLIETSPNFYGELATVLSAPVWTLPDSPTESEDFKRRWTTLLASMANPEAKDYRNALNSYRRLLREDFNLSRDETFLLAYMTRNLVNQTENPMPTRLKSLMRAYRDSRGYEEFDPLIVGVQNRFTESVQGRPENDRFYRQLAVAIFSASKLGLKLPNLPEWTVSIGSWKTPNKFIRSEVLNSSFDYEDWFSKQHKKNQLSLSVAIATTELQCLFDEVMANEVGLQQEFKEFQSRANAEGVPTNQDAALMQRVFELRNVILDSLEKHLNESYPGVEVPENIINLLDFVFFGASLVESPQKIRTAVLDQTKSILLGAKGELSSWRSQQTAAKTAAAARAAPLEPFRFVPNLASEASQPRNLNKRRNLSALAETTGAPEQSPLRQLTREPQELEYWIQYPNAELRAGLEYHFSFFRHPEMSQQKIVFTESVTRFLNDHPDERARFIRAINLGYTARTSQGTPGIKLLHAKGDQQQNLYEAKPGRSNHRILMLFENGVWEAQRMMSKDEMEAI